MSVSLMFQTAEPRDLSADYAAITEVSKADPASPFPNEGYVAIDAATVVAVAALLGGAVLRNGETVTTYDFSREADEDGPAVVEAHVSSFGPSLLPLETLAALKGLLASHPHAVRMLDVVVARGLQLLLSTDDALNRGMPHMKGVNWIADEVEINSSKSFMLDMMGTLGFRFDRGAEAGEVPFDRFALAVDEAGFATRASDRLDAFVACARRNGATSVYWA